MILLFNSLVLLLYSSALFAFDVRVLLEKYSFDDTKRAHCTISSQHGLLIAGQTAPMYGKVSIIATDTKFIVGDKTFENDYLVICPALQPNHQKKINQFVSDWYKEHEQVCISKLTGLSAFYEQFVNDSAMTSYAPLYTTLQECINAAIFSFLQPIVDPVISYESLVKFSQKHLAQSLKVSFTQAIHEKKLSKDFLKKIRNIEKVRTHFFVTMLEKILVDFLTDYFNQLPHKIMYQAMKEETGCLLFEKNKYLGSFYLVRTEKELLLINSLDIDDYLFSVLRSEGWPGWPMEVNKALVVASRTYLVEKILQANKSKSPYHIVNSIKHQTYKGHHKAMSLKKAVDETRNIFIAYQGKPIAAMFDACCGGVIPAHIEGIDYKKHPYLARSKSCTYCKKFAVYDWKKEFTRLELTETFRQDHPDLKDVTDITITKKDPAGLVREVLVTTKDQKIYVSGKKMYSLFPAIKSFCYTIKKKNKLFTFHGRGYGHHIGLCQWGAFGMVQDNWNYKNILQFYYPGTEFMKLSLSR